MSEIVDQDGDPVTPTGKVDSPELPRDRVELVEALKKYAASDTGHADSIEFIEASKERLPYLMPQEAVILLYAQSTAILGLQADVEDLLGDDGEDG